MKNSELESEADASSGCIHKTIDIAKEVYVASNKLRGLGELFCMARSEPPMSDSGFIGVSEFLIEISGGLDDLLDVIRALSKKAAKYDLQAGQD